MPAASIPCFSRFLGVAALAVLGIAPSGRLWTTSVSCPASASRCMAFAGKTNLAEGACGMPSACCCDMRGRPSGTSRPEKVALHRTGPCPCTAAPLSHAPRLTAAPVGLLAEKDGPGSLAPAPGAVATLDLGAPLPAAGRLTRLAAAGARSPALLPPTPLRL